ncbi:MAG: response regulator transcription factor [Clostridiaceae bacterium]|nr:response regulator transcription factor [Clostridiaceae bacterium]
MSEARILIADDESRMRKLVSDFLKKEGFFVIEAENGQRALEIFFQEQNIDLVILDVMMPELDGWSVCRQIRKVSRVPVIMLTARSEEADELFGFDIGADEYITKPFSPMILVARVQALLRRAGNMEKTVKTYMGLKIDEAGRDVFVDGNKVDLSPKEFELLVFLTDNKGVALSREQILNCVWNYDYFGDVRTVDTHIKKLRLKLGDKGDLIQTVRGLGYKFEVKK